MEIEELRQFIQASDFTPQTKQKIAVMLAGKAVLDYDTYAGVKEILQQELDSDFKEAGVDLSNDPQDQADELAYEAELEQLNATLDNDLQFIEEEKKKLEEIDVQIAQAEEAAPI